MYSSKSKDIEVYSQFTTPSVSDCECDDRHKVIVRIQSKFAPMRHEQFHNPKTFFKKATRRILYFFELISRQFSGIRVENIPP